MKTKIGLREEKPARKKDVFVRPGKLLILDRSCRVKLISQLLLACVRNHCPQFLIPQLHELLRLVQHGNHPEEVRHAYPFCELRRHTLLLAFLIEEETFLVNRILGTHGDVARWKRFDGRVEEDRREGLRRGSVVPFCRIRTSQNLVKMDEQMNETYLDPA